MTRNIEVAKFGGTSMARLDIVQAHLEHGSNHADVVITSAPGKDKDNPDSIKLTDMAHDYVAAPNKTKRSNIQQQVAEAALRADPAESNNELWDIVEKVPKDILEWQANGNPVAGLGEYWSAQMLSSVTDYKFVDARHVIKFDVNGRYDAAATRYAIQKEIDGSQPVVMPGYYGADADGRVRLFDRGGSDTSGAIVSIGLGASQYHVWSDTDGLLTANPKQVPNTQLRDTVTYREARELGNGGSELLNRTAIMYLGSDGARTETVLRNTFGSSHAMGTRVVHRRDHTDTPIAAVTSRDDLLELTLHQFGLNEEVGATVPLYSLLRDESIPYEHTATGTDDVAVFLADKYRNGIKKVAHQLGNNASLKAAGMIHIVGEGLARSGSERFYAIGQVASAFAAAGVESLGTTDVAGSAALTFFIEPQSVGAATQIAHDTLILNRK